MLNIFFYAIIGITVETTPLALCRICEEHNVVFWFDTRIGCETSGVLKRKSKNIIDYDFHYMIYALNNLPISKSETLLLLPFSKGNSYLSSDILWKEPVDESGKILKGKWEHFGVIKLNKSISREIDETDAYYVILISESHSLQTGTIPSFLKYIL